MNKYSITIPNFNKGKYLQECISSVLNQTYDDIELIIIDDCSTDNSWQFINQYPKNPKVKILRHPKNMGKTYTFNEGLSLSTGDYVTILGSDDWLKPEAIDTINQKIQNSLSQPDIIYTNIFLYDNNTKTVRDGADEGLFSQYLKTFYFLFGCKLTSLCTFYSRNLIKGIKCFDEEFSSREQDYDFFIRALDFGGSAYIPEPLGYYRWGANNSIDKNEAETYIRNFRRIIEKNKTILSKQGKQKYYQTVLAFAENTLQHYPKDTGFFVKLSLLGTLLMAREKGYKFSVYGCGELGKKALEFAEEIGLTVNSVYDSFNYGQQTNGITIKNPSLIKPVQNELLVICSTGGKIEIAAQLDKQGLVHGKDYFFTTIMISSTIWPRGKTSRETRCLRGFAYI